MVWRSGRDKAFEVSRRSRCFVPFGRVAIIVRYPSGFEEVPVSEFANSFLTATGEMLIQQGDDVAACRALGNPVVWRVHASEDICAALSWEHDYWHVWGISLIVFKFGFCKMVSWDEKVQGKTLAVISCRYLFHRRMHQAWFMWKGLQVWNL